MAAQQQLIAVVEITLDLEQRLAQPDEPVVQLHDPFLIIGMVHAPCAGDRMQNQDIRDMGSPREHEAGACEQVVQQCVVAPPRLMVAEGRRAVSLAESTQGVQQEMGAEEIDAEHEHPVYDPALIVKSHALTEIGEQLAQHPSAPELMGDAADLLGQGNRVMAHAGVGIILRVDPPLTVQVIDPGDVHVLVVRHHGAARADLPGEIILTLVFVLMAGQTDVTSFAPIVQTASEDVDEQLGNRPIEVVARSLVLPDIIEQRCQKGQEIVAPPSLEAGGEFFGPRDGMPRVLWFIGKNPRDLSTCAHDRGESAEVDIVGAFEKRCDDFRVQSVNVMIPLFDVEFEDRLAGMRAGDDGFPGDILELAQGPSHAIPQESLHASRRRGVDAFKPLDAPGAATQRLAGVVTSPSGDKTARETTWEPVLVVEPGLHPETPSLFDAGLDAGHPLLAQVRRRQADPGVHEVSSQPGAAHLAYLMPELVRRELVVPGPERRRSVLHAVARLCDFAELFLRIVHQSSSSDLSQRSRNRFGPS